MMFLASTFADCADLFQERVRRGRVVFCANAADPWEGQNDEPDPDSEAFKARGYLVNMLDLRKCTPHLLTLVLRNADVLHCGGGSAIYLLKLLREKLFGPIIKRAIQCGLVYSGTSAGSMIMAPDISFCADDEDEQHAGMVGKLDDMTGLGLIPFYLVCHAQDPTYIPSTKRAMDRLAQNKLPLLFMNDGMALWCEASKCELVQTAGGE